MKKILVMSVFAMVLPCVGWSKTLGVIPGSAHIYANEDEHMSLLSVPWANRSVKDPVIEFACPKCVEEQPVDRKYADTMKFNGVIKFVGGSVLDAFTITVVPRTDAQFDRECSKLESASPAQLESPDFLRSFTSISGRRDLVEMGATRINGRNALWTTLRMERRIGNQVVYRGLSRSYMIPVKGYAVMVGFMSGATFVEEFPYNDFKAFLPVGEKFVRSIKIKEKSKWSLW